MNIAFLSRNSTMLFIIILLSGAGCQSSPQVMGELPTLVELSTVIPTTTPTPTIPRSTATLSPTLEPPTITPILIPTLPPTSTPRPSVDLPEFFRFGTSVQGRDLTARRIGDGSTILMLVGGIHGGYEVNTVMLIEQMIDHFDTTPTDVLPGITLVLIPSLNPDGAALPNNLQGRFNGRGVDLNRNWGCGWESVAYFRDQEVNPGVEAFSEPETTALASLITTIYPATVLFYHSAANGIYGGNCDGSGTSNEMIAALAWGTDYPLSGAFTEYAVTGTAAAWVDSIGIPSADVELARADETELRRNLEGVISVQCWLLGQAALDIPRCIAKRQAA